MGWGLRAWQFPTFAWQTATLSSALNGFTSEFGMGSGGSHSLWSPSKLVCQSYDCSLMLKLFCFYILSDGFGKFYTYRWKSVTRVISDNQVTLTLYNLHCSVLYFFILLQLRIALYTSLHLKLIGCYMVKPHGQLVHVSFTHYCASTPCLSTS